MNFGAHKLKSLFLSDMLTIKMAVYEFTRAVAMYYAVFRRNTQAVLKGVNLFK